MPRCYTIPGDTRTGMPGVISKRRSIALMLHMRKQTVTNLGLLVHGKWTLYDALLELVFLMCCTTCSSNRALHAAV